MVQRLLDPAPIAIPLKEQLSKCCHNLFAVKQPVNLETVGKGVDRAFTQADEERNLAVRRYLSRTGIAHSSAVLHSLGVSGAEGLDNFPEIPARDRVEIARFWTRCTNELLEERIRINCALASARNRRAQRNQTSAGRRPIQGRKENLRWLQVAGPYRFSWSGVKLPVERL